MSAQMRIGRYVACAATMNEFDEFGDRLLVSCREKLENPIRFLTLNHLINSAALDFPRLTSATKPLLEGYVFEFVARGQLCRLNTVSRSGNSYSVLFSPSSVDTWAAIRENVIKRLRQRGKTNLSDWELAFGSFTNRELEILFGHLISTGNATVSVFDGLEIAEIFIPE